MRIRLHVALIALTLGFKTIMPAVASAGEVKCLEGMTASGACVDPKLARHLRKQTFLMTQPKLSYTAPPEMPGDDDVVGPDGSRYEILNLLTPQTSRGRFAAP